MLDTKSLSPFPFNIVRMLTHMAMLLGACNHPQVNNKFNADHSTSQHLLNCFQGTLVGDFNLCVLNTNPIILVILRAEEGV